MEKLEVIKDNCIACGICINMSESTEENVFGWDDEGKAKVIEQKINDNVKNIAESCPTGAIIVNE